MGKFVLFFFILLLCVLTSRFFTQQVKFDYLQQTPPGDIPGIFVPGIVSVENKNSHALVISPDGKYMFFTKLNFNPTTGYTYWVKTSFLKDLKNSLYKKK